MIAGNWDCATAPIISAALSTSLATRCFCMLSGIAECEIGEHDFTFVGSQPGLGMMTHVM